MQGTGGGFELEIGGTIAENVNLFGKMGGASVINPRLIVSSAGIEAEETTNDVSLTQVHYSIGVQYYFGETNVYLGGGIGGSRAELDFDITDELVDGEDPTASVSEWGWEAHLAVGKEWWVSDNWGLGIALPPGGGGGSWEEANASNFSLEAVRDYITAVRASVDAYIANLTDEELSRMVQSIGGEQPIAAVLALIVVHAAGHYGEVAALKGTQGAKGLPF